MTLEQTLERINHLADGLLVELAENSESRFLISLPPLLPEEQATPILDCMEYVYGLSQLREILVYKYLLLAFKTKKLAVSRESLAFCLSQMRQSPVIDYYDLGDYHEYAYAYYKKMEDERKALRHLISCYSDRGRAIVSADKTFDSKDWLMAILKDHQRFESLLLYILDFIVQDLEDVQVFLKRSQYLLLERALLFAVKIFAENPKQNVQLRSAVYTVQSLYYDMTDRTDDAKAARMAAKKLGGSKNYERVLAEYRISQPAPHLADERFVDYLLFINALEEYEVYPMDEKGNLNLEYEYDDFILAKDGRLNFMDTFYRQMPSVLDFQKLYEQAEAGEASAITELARRYRQGEGVSASECAAAAWETKLK